MNLYFNFVDFIVVAVIIISAGYAAYRGFMNETLTIFSWALTRHLAGPEEPRSRWQNSAEAIIETIRGQIRALCPAGSDDPPRLRPQGALVPARFPAIIATHIKPTIDRNAPSPGWRAAGRTIIVEGGNVSVGTGHIASQPPG